MWEAVESVAVVVVAIASLGIGWSLGYLAGRLRRQDDNIQNDSSDLSRETKRGLISESDARILDTIFGTSKEHPLAFDQDSRRIPGLKCDGVGKWIVIYEGTTNNAWTVCDAHVGPFLGGPTAKKDVQGIRIHPIHPDRRKAGSCTFSTSMP